MKVTLTESGGHAAGMRRPPRVVETGALPATEIAELERLVAAAAAASSKGADGPGRGRDAMTYSITVEQPGKGPRVIKASDTDLPPAFDALMQWIKRRA